MTYGDDNYQRIVGTSGKTPHYLHYCREYHAPDGDPDPHWCSKPEGHEDAGHQCACGYKWGEA